MPIPVPARCGICREFLEKFLALSDIKDDHEDLYFKVKVKDPTQNLKTRLYSESQIAEKFKILFPASGFSWCRSFTRATTTIPLVFFVRNSFGGL
jgi:hypothetical protein